MILTDLLEQRLEFGIATDGHDEHLDGSHGGREREHTAVHVILAGPVRVLQQRVQNPAKTERRLNHVRHELAHCRKKSRV